MSSKKNEVGGVGRKVATATGLAVMLTAPLVGSGTSGGTATGKTTEANLERQIATTQGKFYCNIKALTPEERAHHAKLTQKLKESRTDIVETAKGYEFQFSPKVVTVAEVADWVTAESKCCPFFDFHIDLENEGQLVCLRLTGEEGIKAFIREEFQVAAK
jgi:hypothetical protein